MPQPRLGKWRHVVPPHHHARAHVAVHWAALAVWSVFVVVALAPHWAGAVDPFVQALHRLHQLMH